MLVSHANCRRLLASSEPRSRERRANMTDTKGLMSVREVESFIETSCKKYQVKNFDAHLHITSHGHPLSTNVIHMLLPSEMLHQNY